jgi:hypothetical protein
MLDSIKKNKLIELTSKAVSINEQILEEEKNFIDAVEQHLEMRFLTRISDKINNLLRKEVLFVGATNSLLKRLEIE